MAFSKKTWKDRVSQYINRRLLTDSDGNTQHVTVTRDEGSVTEAGDAFSASNMNDLEDRIENAFDALTAADIPYSSGVSVADKLDDMTTYSSTEKAVGTWIDGSTIYQKTVDCGTMPNNTTINIDTQISNLARVIELKGTCFNSNTGSVLPLPMIGSNNYLSLSMLGTNISIGTNVDRSGYTGYVTVTYLKSV